VGSLTAAPVSENQPTRATAISQQQQKSHKGGKKNKMFTEEDMKAWRNSCNAVGTTGSTQQLDRAQAYNKVCSVGVNGSMFGVKCYHFNFQTTQISIPFFSSQFQFLSQIKMTVTSVDHDLKNNDYINTTDLANWEKFRGSEYNFLPRNPEVSSVLLSKFSRISKVSLQ
jgi:hypothetical protein